MGFFNRKKKEENFDNLPYLPDDDALPPLPNQPRGMHGMPPLPPMAKRPMPRELPPMGSREEPPMLPIHRPEEPRKLPPMPKLHLDRPMHDKIPDMMPKLPELKHNDFIPVEAKGPAPKSARVFVQLKKYKDIVNTVGKMEGRINDLQNSINKIKDIRAKEGDLIDGWNKLLSEAKEKIEDVNKKLPSVDDY
jgi:hypothetical protein